MVEPVADRALRLAQIRDRKKRDAQRRAQRLNAPNALRRLAEKYGPA
jgi:hypothetical protein